MPYVASNDERCYAVREQEFGKAAATVTASSRIPIVKFSGKRESETIRRLDKTGTRTFQGAPVKGRRQTSFEIRSYLSSWAEAPNHGALMESALGADAQIFGGGETAAGTTASQIVFVAPHGLSTGQAISINNEMRFVSAVVDAVTVQLNAPLSIDPGAGALAGVTYTYRLATNQPSVSLYDFWGRGPGASRLVTGAVVDEMRLILNGDVHEIRYRGVARDLIEEAAFSTEASGLTEFPTETDPTSSYALVAGSLGQAWLGSSIQRTCAVTGAEIVVNNNVDGRSREFGHCAPAMFFGGEREVTARFSLYYEDPSMGQQLAQCARNGDSMPVMLQLGDTVGQTCAVYLPAVVPTAPDFDDSEARLQWQITAARAQGTGDDELFIAFG